MATAAILATGSAVPPGIRTNDDPIFDWIKANPPPGPPLFTGYKERRVLAPGATLASLMAEAAGAALTKASVAAADIDLVVGYASFGSWAMPNDLVTMASSLGVPPTAMIMPINSEYANFEHGLLTAEGLLETGRATNALIVVGADWTRFVNYHEAPCVSAGDGAGAAVMAVSRNPALWRIRDVAVTAEWQYLGGMFVAPDPAGQPVAPPSWTAPTFHITDVGYQAFKNFGFPEPPALVKEVLERNGLTPAQIAFVGHQTSATLNQYWTAALAPGIFVQTLEAYANMTSASIPVNLDVCAAQITGRHAVLVGLGPEPSCTVLLLERAAVP